MQAQEWTIGVIGLGQMGGGIAANLVRAGYSVLGYDLRAGTVERLVEAGGHGASDSLQIVDDCEVVLTCVEGRDLVHLADMILLPNARSGQVFIDHSTVPVPETRRIGSAFVSAGARYLDAPVSGGAQGAADGTLRVFVGGDRSTAERCWALFEAIGNRDKVMYCGPVGMGQVAKVVQQLTHRFPDVARMEVMAFGLRGGLDLETLMRALDVDPESGDPYARLGRAIGSRRTDDLSALYSEWTYYLEAARAGGFRMPMLEAMYEFCKDAELTAFDPLGRPMPSIWNELMRES